MSCEVVTMANDYIKRRDALMVIETANKMASNLLEATMKLCVAMNSVAAADVVPVVRCQDCKHWTRIKRDCILASCELDALVRCEDFYCAAGERRKDDG